jgi:hypothetical protein
MKICSCSDLERMGRRHGKSTDEYCILSVQVQPGFSLTDCTTLFRPKPTQYIGRLRSSNARPRVATSAVNVFDFDFFNTYGFNTSIRRIIFNHVFFLCYSDPLNGFGGFASGFFIWSFYMGGVGCYCTIWSSFLCFTGAVNFRIPKVISQGVI